MAAAISAPTESAPAWPVPDRGEQWGFVADELAAIPQLKPLISTDRDGKPDGYDVAQVLALTVAQVQLLKARIAKLEGRAA